MTTSENSSQHPSFRVPVLTGAGIGLGLITLFLLGAGEPNPEWGKLWRLRPLIVVTLAGASGGFFFYLLLRYRSVVGLNKYVAIAIGLITFVVGLWLGSVLGLAGTYWD